MGLSVAAVETGRAVLYVECGGWADTGNGEELQAATGNSRFEVVDDRDIFVDLPDDVAVLDRVREAGEGFFLCGVPTLDAVREGLAWHECVHGPALVVLDRIEDARPWSILVERDELWALPPWTLTGKEADAWRAHDLHQFATRRRDAPTLVISDSPVGRQEIRDKALLVIRSAYVTGAAETLTVERRSSIDEPWSAAVALVLPQHETADADGDAGPRPARDVVGAGDGLAGHSGWPAGGTSILSWHTGQTSDEDSFEVATTVDVEVRFTAGEIEIPAGVNWRKHLAGYLQLDLACFVDGLFESDLLGIRPTNAPHTLGATMSAPGKAKDDDINIPVTDDQGFVNQEDLVCRVIAELQILRRCTPRLDPGQMLDLGATLLGFEPLAGWVKTLTEAASLEDAEPPNFTTVGMAIAGLRAEGRVVDLDLEHGRLGPDGRRQIVRVAREFAPAGVAPVLAVPSTSDVDDNHQGADDSMRGDDPWGAPRAAPEPEA